MIDPHEFAQGQLELTAEFGKFVFEHPEVDDHLPDGAVCFQIEGEANSIGTARHSPSVASTTKVSPSCVCASKASPRRKARD